MRAAGKNAAADLPGINREVPVSGFDPLISVSELRAALGSAEPPVVLDVRSGRGGASAPGAERIPSAVPVGLQADLSGPGGPHDGRLPLPDPHALQASLRRWGVRAGRLVVVYDGSAGLAAGRAWWTLRWAGHFLVRVLDGGLRAWTAEGGETTSGAAGVPEPGDVTVRPGSVPALTAGDVAALPATGVLVDARPPDRYAGAAGDPLDPVAGHIPGAVNLPAAATLGDDGRFLPPAELRKRFAGAGLEGRSPVVVYCGSGVSAAHELLALEVAGLEGVLYPPSWSGWTSDPARPVATGRG